jgi:hypothetical protein
LFERRRSDIGGDGVVGPGQIFGIHGVQSLVPDHIARSRRNPR